MMLHQYLRKIKFKGVKMCCPRIGREGQGQLFIELAEKKFLASREGAAEGGGGGWGGKSRPPRPFRRSEAEAVSSAQKRFARSV
jgi:hypothetical protein